MSDQTVTTDELLAELRSQIEAYGRGAATAEYRPDGTVLRANDAFAELVGAGPATIAGAEHSTLISPETAGTAEYATLWEQLRSGSDLTNEYRLLWQGSRDRWIRSSWVPVRNAAGQVVKVIEHALDVTEGKRAAADAAGKIQAISRSQAVIEFGLDGTILDANDNFLRLVGYTREEVVGKHHRMFVSAHDAESPAYRGFWQSLGAGEFFSGEFRRIGRGGREVWLQAVYNPILGVDGKPWKVVKFAVDVTAAKLANAEFEGKVAAINRSQAVIEFDLDGRILTANDNFLRTVGYQLPEIAGRHHSMFCTPEYADSAEYREFWAALRGGEFRSGRFHRHGKNGRDVWIQSSYNPILDLSGKPVKVVKYAYDVTEQVRLEQKLSVPA
ncbi:PAS domain-containing protein [Actinoplanes sp. G11-F43]|uniref:PAS domain-containing protein n=1 Tax=Actinoplanes sp. G11-F43 TaxID=3424130 RepID=UPI003D34C0E3